MKKILRPAAMITFLITALLGPAKPAAASLSEMLGATQLGAGIDNFAKCENEFTGYHEGLIADRLELKLANTPNVSAADRQLWLTDIRILRQVQQTHQPDRTNNQHFFLGLTDQEQVAINSMTNYRREQVRIACEDKYGSMSRFSNSGQSDLQDKYVADARANLNKTQPMDINSIPVEPFTTPKTSAQKYQERMAKYHASQQAGAQQMQDCITSSKGLRPKLVAQALQKKLDSSSNLSAAERAEIQADIQVAWASAGKGLDRIESADPKNPYRAEQYLSPQELTDLNSQYSTQYLQALQGCTAGKRH